MKEKLKNFLEVLVIIINITFSTIGGFTVGRYIATALPEPVAFFLAAITLIILGVSFIQCLLYDYRKKKGE